MKTMFVLLALIPLLCTDSSVSPEHIAPGLDKDFDLAVGQSATIDNGFTFTFISVPSDSRCPTSVLCVWAGDAAVVLRFDHRLDTLHTTLEPRDLTTNEYTIQLIMVSPYPEYPGTIPKDSYVIKLRVGKK
jgi:hypothetical protein